MRRLCDFTGFSWFSYSKPYIKLQGLAPLKKQRSHRTSGAKWSWKLIFSHFDVLSVPTYWPKMSAKLPRSSEIQPSTDFAGELPFPAVAYWRPIQCHVVHQHARRTASNSTLARRYGRIPDFFTGLTKRMYTNPNHKFPILVTKSIFAPN